MNLDKSYSRRVFVRRMGLMLGIGAVGSAALAACGDEPTATPARATPVARTAPAATPALATLRATVTPVVQATPAPTTPAVKMTLAPLTPANATGEKDLGAVADFATLTEPQVVTIGDHSAFITTINGKVSVLSAVCTHQGCAVAWDSVDKQYACPCHGSIFDAQGINIGGPAPKPLKIISSRVVNGRLVVSTKK